MATRRYPIRTSARARGREAKAEKISITVDENVLREVREIVRSEGGNLSAHITEALARDLRRRRLQQIVDDYEREHGVIDERELRKVRRTWRD
jgi:hypothetical protein